MNVVKRALRSPAVRTGLLASAAIAAGLIALGRANRLPEAPDQFTYDLRTYYLGDRMSAPRSDMAIILIDENSLRGYPYLSPVDRGLTTELIQTLRNAGVKAIGLDFIIDRPTEAQKDEAFIQALKEVHGDVPLVVGTIDERSKDWPKNGIAFQEEIIARTGVETGHIYFGTEQDLLSAGDSTVRYIVPPSKTFPARDAFSKMLAGAAGKQFVPASRLIYWRLPPAMAGVDAIPTFTVPPHRDEQGNKTGPVLPDDWIGALTGKIVLVGGAFSDRDWHYTPYSVVTGERKHGVEIHAQILSQLLDEKSIYLLPWWIEWLILTLVMLAGIVSEYRWQFTQKRLWWDSLLAFLVIVGFSAILFAAGPLVLPTATLFLAWPLGLFAGGIMRGFERYASRTSSS